MNTTELRMKDQESTTTSNKRKSIIICERDVTRVTWEYHSQYIFACLGFVVGFGNIWRFPYLCFKYGGGAFFIPYFTMIILIGAPAFFLEVCLGQYTSQCPVTCYGFAPIFRGLGFASVIISFLITSFYSVAMAWVTYYFYESFKKDIPWDKCRDPWKTSNCRNLKAKCTDDQFHPVNDCTNCGYFLNETTRICYKSQDSQDLGINFRIRHKRSAEQPVSSAHQYLTNSVLGYTRQFHELTDTGSIQWHLFICLTLSYIALYLVLVRGIRLVGNVSYVAVSAPYVLLFLLLANGASHDGAAEGIKFYLTPNTTVLLSSEVWVEAATHVFNTLSVSWGGLITLSSYNKFHNNILRDTVIIVIGDFLTSVFSGFVIFSYIGFISKEEGVPVLFKGIQMIQLAFGVYPMAVSLMPAPHFWSATFFLTCMTMQFTTALVTTQTVITAFQDLFPEFRSKIVIIVLCLILWIIGTPMTFQAGMRIEGAMYAYVATWNSILIVFLQFIAVAHVYGCGRFLDDIEHMIDADTRAMFIPWRLWRRYWFVCWYLISPLVGFVLIIIALVKYSSSFTYSHWSMNVFGFLLTMVSVTFIFGTMIYDIATTPGSLRQRFKILTSPSVGWRLVNKSEVYSIKPLTIENSDYSIELSQDKLDEAVMKLYLEEMEDPTSQNVISTWL